MYSEWSRKVDARANQFLRTLSHQFLHWENRRLADAELQVLTMIPNAYCRTRIRPIFSYRQNCFFFVSCVLLLEGIETLFKF